ncbi:Protein of unknown function [Pyronema omphalodes CBS 100304]|uniref:Uncharacterized protein n=1 Tax=Pyronema omphalodes (strain CBS 100304) TaxID=1076935 RepID=U4LVZ9_PYROM|nr:Protein of unknown function [Pyronema omphalodes CBS 100304]
MSSRKSRDKIKFYYQKGVPIRAIGQHLMKHHQSLVSASRERDNASCILGEPCLRHGVECALCYVHSRAVL